MEKNKLRPSLSPKFDIAPKSKQDREEQKAIHQDKTAKGNPMNQQDQLETPYPKQNQQEQFQKAQEKLEEIIRAQGIRLFGHIQREDLESYRPYYQNRPQKVYSEFEVVAGEAKLDLPDKAYLTFALPYYRGQACANQGFSIYTMGLDYHRVARMLLEPVVSFLEDSGYYAKLYCDSNALPERLMAACSGLGKLGKNSLLITEEYGSFVFLAEIATDFPYSGQEAQSLESPCGDCDLCQRVCPSQILWDPFVDTPRCLSALTQKKDLSQASANSLRGRLFGCDSCQKVCPLNKGIAEGFAAFEPFPFMKEANLEELLFLDNATFKEKYAKTSAGWRGKALLSRNALWALKEQGKLPNNLSFSSPMVQNAYDTLLKNEHKR